MKEITCFFKGHEMTLTKDQTLEPLKIWRCKRCSFSFTAPPEESYEGTKMIFGGMSRKEKTDETP